MPVATRSMECEQRGVPGVPLSRGQNFVTTTYFGSGPVRRAGCRFGQGRQRCRALSVPLCPTLCSPQLSVVMSVPHMYGTSLDKTFFLLPKVHCFLYKAFAYDLGMRLGGTSYAKRAGTPSLHLRPSPTWKGSCAPHLVVTCLQRSL